MRTAVRTNAEPQLELFSVNALRIPIYETTYPIRPDGRAALAGIPPANGRGTRSDEPAPRDDDDGGGTDRNGTGPASPAVDPAGSDAASGARPGLGNGAGEIHLPPARVHVHHEDAEADAGVDVQPAEPEPLRNQNNY